MPVVNSRWNHKQRRMSYEEEEEDTGLSLIVYGTTSNGTDA